MLKAQVRRLVGNPDVYAVQRPNGAWFGPIEKKSWFEDDQLLASHEAGEVTLGTYVVHEDQARTLVFDIDKGEGQESAAMADALALTQALEDLGVPKRGVGLEFSGRKGYHVWVVFGDYADAADLRRLGRAAQAVAGVECELFPKQDKVRNVGSLVKLPGGKHQVTGKANDFVGKVPTPISVQVLQDLVAELPEVEAPKVSDATYDSMLPCFTRIQNGPTEGWRNHGIYHGAVLARRGGLTEENVLDLMLKAAAKANETSDDPITEEEVIRTVESSREGGPMCHNIPEEYRCGDACVAKRNAGLHTRAGEFKFGQEGEVKTVRIKRRDGKFVELDHEDIEQGKVVLK